jgi:hypothetical protein
MSIQVILIIFILFALWLVLRKTRRKELTQGRALLWVFFWIFAGFAVLYPNTTVWVANKLGVGRGADLVSYISILVLFYLVFRILVRLERMERNITHLVREDALKNSKKQ